MRRPFYKIYLRISPGRFHYLKFILEGYDNLAILSSYDNRKGIVAVRFPGDLALEVFDLLGAVSGDVSV
jgi:hypothetical protein